MEYASRGVTFLIVGLILLADSAQVPRLPVTTAPQLMDAGVDSDLGDDSFFDTGD
jgi:hypothetical protein